MGMCVDWYCLEQKSVLVGNKTLRDITYRSDVEIDLPATSKEVYDRLKWSRDIEGWAKENALRWLESIGQHAVVRTWNDYRDDAPPYDDWHDTEGVWDLWELEADPFICESRAERRERLEERRRQHALDDMQRFAGVVPISGWWSELALAPALTLGPFWGTMPDTW